MRSRKGAPGPKKRPRLTPREREVVAMILKRNILGKLRIHRREEIASLAW
jgi:DNA-binding CsgD family transcriptional regulator